EGAWRQCAMGALLLFTADAGPASTAGIAPCRAEPCSAEALQVEHQPWLGSTAEPVWILRKAPAEHGSALPGAGQGLSVAQDFAGGSDADAGGLGQAAGGAIQ